MSLTDVPPPAQTRVQAGTTATIFGEVALFADESVLRGRRVGSVILLAGNVPAIKPGKYERVLHGGELSSFTGGASPRLDEPG